MKKEEISKEILLERLEIVETGSGIIWKQNTRRTKKGDIFGSLDKGYWRGDITISGVTYRYAVHRLKFFLLYNWWPEVVDHIDGNPSNNKKENIRGCTQAQNKQNSKNYSSNTSGVKGVRWIEAKKRWRGIFMANGITYHVGMFSTKEEAEKATQLKRDQVCGEFSRHT